MAGGEHQAARVGVAGDEPVGVDREYLGELDQFDGRPGAAVAQRFGEFLLGQADLRGDLGLGEGVRGDAVGGTSREPSWPSTMVPTLRGVETSATPRVRTISWCHVSEISPPLIARL